MAFGAVEDVKERSREARGTAFVESLVLDVRYAIRGLRARPAFAFGVALTLALGIGANAAMFGIEIGAGLAALCESAAHPAASMDDACDTIIRALNPRGGRKDDVALLMARLNGIPREDVAVWELAAEPAEVGRATPVSPSSSSARLISATACSGSVRAGTASPPCRRPASLTKSAVCRFSRRAKARSAPQPAWLTILGGGDTSCNVMSRSATLRAAPSTSKSKGSSGP